MAYSLSMKYEHSCFSFEQPTIKSGQINSFLFFQLLFASSPFFVKF